jgi:glycosyltransferase involved in cell wall biosynthesis
VPELRPFPEQTEFMRVLLLNQIFWPDRAGSARLMTDLARHLAEGGVEVVVVAGAAACAVEHRAMPPVRIVRTPSLLTGRSLPLRVLSFLCYSGMALMYALFGPKPDLVVTLTTPPLLSLVGVLAKRLRGCRHFIWEMDLYPEVAMDVRILRRSSLAARALSWIANMARSRADGIIVIGECMRARLAGSGLPAERLVVSENWADGQLIRDTPLRPDLPVTLLYSGNLGRVHEIETIALAMLAMRLDPRIRFLFVGGGPARADLRAFCREHDINNAVFGDYRTSDALPALLGDAHIGLVSLRAACLGASVPSKMYEYMAAGRPLLFVGPPESTTAKVIERHACGWHTPPGDVDGLVRTLRLLLDDGERISRAGANARRAFLAHYDLPQAVSRVCRILGIAFETTPSNV